jgi:hypothetical protein
VGRTISQKRVNIDRFYQLVNKSIDTMRNKAETQLNPEGCILSDEAKKRLKWMYIIHAECNGKIARAARKVGVTRQWLSTIHSSWIKADRNPLSLEPQSTAPINTDNRRRVSAEVEAAILKARKEYHWGKDKLMTVLDRDEKIKVGSSTINRCLDSHGLLDIKISARIKQAHLNKKIERRQKCRPPKEIKDYKPGALIEKDMKFIVKLGSFRNIEKYKAKENFWNQHTAIDSFTRIRTLGLAEGGDSLAAVTVQIECEKRFPFNIACANTDNGSENEKDFDKYLAKNNIVHFYSRSGTPTDNPRVERSHLTDEVEFYQRGNICQTFEEQKKRLAKWEYRYNYVRPHQALGNLTPMAFYELWKTDPEAAYKIAEKWQAYLKKQSKRLASSRKMKNRDKIRKLMEQIDLKLNDSHE